MVMLLLLLGFIAVVAGTFSLAVGVPVRDTTFGAALLMAGSVAVTGGFILVGLAAAVSELRRALKHLRLPERGEAERGRGAGRRMEPRIDTPAAHGPDATQMMPDHVIPTRFDAPERAAVAETLDTIRPSDERKPPEWEVLGPRAGAPVAAGTADDMRSPPLSPTEAAAAASGAALRPPSRVLKSGTINDVAYTLFSDGSIETPTLEGTLRFASIDEFRKHLEKITG